MKNFLGILLAVMLASPAFGAITDNEKYLLNNKMGSVAAKVQLGTVIQNAENGLVGTGTITTAEILNGTILNADVSTSAAIALSKLAAMTSGYLLVGSAATVPTAVAMSGDATIVAAGTLTIATGAVTSAKVLDDTLVVGDLNTTVMAEANVTLTAANIAAMNGAPVTLLATPGAGKVIVVDEIEFFHDYAVAAYANGGDVTIEYETSGLDINVFDVALVTAGADDNWLIKPLTYTSAAGTGTHASLTANANKAVLITNATAAFDTGNAANIIKMRIRYHVVTLLT